MAHELLFFVNKLFQSCDSPSDKSFLWEVSFGETLKVTENSLKSFV
jgi:hypothetical protein